MLYLQRKPCLSKDTGYAHTAVATGIPRSRRRSSRRSRRRVITRDLGHGGATVTAGELWGGLGRVWAAGCTVVSTQIADRAP